MKIGPFGLVLAVAIASTLVSCQGSTSDAQAPASPPVALAKPGFVNRVWVVSESKEVEKGQIYVFASTGALFITSPHGKPATGSWKYEGGVLTMVEDVPITAEIVSVSEKEMKIKITKPSPVEMTLVPGETPDFTK